MAKSRRLSPNPLIIGIVRAGVRGNWTNTAIRARVRSAVGAYSPTTIDAIITDERDQWRIVQTIQAADKRRTTDLRQLAGCTRPGTTVQIRLKVTVTGGTRGGSYQFGHTVETSSSGRLGAILRIAIDSAKREAQAKGYTPGNPGVSQFSGKVYYSIERIDCN